MGIRLGGIHGGGGVLVSRGLVRCCCRPRVHHRGKKRRERGSGRERERKKEAEEGGKAADLKVEWGVVEDTGGLKYILHVSRASSLGFG